MYNTFTIGRRYLHYLVTAANGRGHGVHSPFVYDLIRNVFLDREAYPAYEIAEAYRRQLLGDTRMLEVRDLGAGSMMGSTRRRRVCDIAKTSVKRPRYGRLLYRIAAYYRCGRIVEMGTSLGVTSSYLSQVPGLERLVTMEGADAVADVAEAHFRGSGFQRTELVRGDFDRTLGRTLQEMGTPDMVFIDGNHREEPTLRYFEQLMQHAHEHTILVFDDIHWSREMEQAWERIRNDERVKLSIDLFFVGLVFFRKDFREKQHFTIRF